MKIMVTGASGYIGSHTCVELLNEGYDIAAVDNFSNSNKEPIARIKSITGRDFNFYEEDICNEKALYDIFNNEHIDVVIHFAGLKSIGESLAKPLEYYTNNITGTLTLCNVMNKCNCKNIIFSSSAAVYGSPAFVPITEKCPTGICTNPYGRTKLMMEQILNDLYVSDSSWNIIMLRYFNPIGAHKSGLIGEDPKGIPNNLLPYISQVAIGKLDYLNIFGDDYDTPDGTGVRDYIHVVDLARGHVKAVEKLKCNKGAEIYNLGTGKGYSVLEVVKAFEKACGHSIKYQIKPRRAGDIASCYCNPYKAKKYLNWTAEYDIDQMCQDAWRWQQNNPNGFNI